MARKWLDPESQIWCICYIASDYIQKLEHDLAKNIFERPIEFYLPTIKVLDKQRKGKKSFKEVPLLFNYGFVKLTVREACNHDFLQSMKDHISCLFSWVKDKSDSIQVVDWNWGDDFYPSSAVIPAVATEEEIQGIRGSAEEFTVYAEPEVDNLIPGKIVTLFTYPWEGVEALLISVNKQKKEAIVEIPGSLSDLRVTVSFDSLIYTLYRGAHDAENYGREKFGVDENKQKSY